MKAKDRQRYRNTKFSTKVNLYLSILPYGMKPSVLTEEELARFVPLWYLELKKLVLAQRLRDHRF